MCQEVDGGYNRSESDCYWYLLATGPIRISPVAGCCVRNRRGKIRNARKTAVFDSPGDNVPPTFPPAVPYRLLSITFMPRVIPTAIPGRLSPSTRAPFRSGCWHLRNGSRSVCGWCNSLRGAFAFNPTDRSSAFFLLLPPCHSRHG